MSKEINTEVNYVSGFEISESKLTIFYTLEIPIYDMEFPIFIIRDDIDNEQLRKDFSEFLRFDDKENEEEFYHTLLEFNSEYNFSMAVPNNIGFWMLVAKHSKLSRKDVIAHECVHIKNLIFRNKGIQADPKNDEPEAYLVGFLFKEIEKIFNQVIELDL